MIIVDFKKSLPWVRIILIIIDNPTTLSVIIKTIKYKTKWVSMFISFTIINSLIIIIITKYSSIIKLFIMCVFVSLYDNIIIANGVKNLLISIIRILIVY